MIIRGVDVASYQTPSRELLDSWIEAGAQLLVVRAYQLGEEAGLQEITRQWFDLAQDAGIWAWPYAWLYSTVPPEVSVREALDLTRSCGGDARLLALDCEEYGDEPGPSIDQILIAAGECYRQRAQPIIYSRAGWLRQRRDLWRLAGLPGWLAQYDSDPVLIVADDAGLQLVGKQYTSLPVDWSVWDIDALNELVGVDPCRSLRDGLATLVGAKPYRPPSKRRLREILEGV